METNDPRLTFGRFLRQIAREHGDRVAVVSPERQLTYAALEAEARTLARALLGAGVAKGARVAVWMGNRPEWIVSAFAVGMTGGVLVPVNTFAKPAELDYILRHSDASTLLMQPELLQHGLLDALLAGHPEILRQEAGRLLDPTRPADPAGAGSRSPSDWLSAWRWRPSSGCRRSRWSPGCAPMTC